MLILEKRDGGLRADSQGGVAPLEALSFANCPAM